MSMVNENMKEILSKSCGGSVVLSGVYSVF